MKQWICKAPELPNIEVIRSHSKPGLGLCELPEDPDRPSGYADVSYVQLRAHYFIPESSTKVELSKINDPIPTYFFNFASRTWNVLLHNEAVPEYWVDDQDVWHLRSLDPAPEGAEIFVKSTTPERHYSAVILEGAKSTFLANTIPSLKNKKIAQVVNQYELLISNAVKKHYPQSERDTWPIKESEANAWNSLSDQDKLSMASTNAQFPLLYEEALRGVYTGTLSEKRASIQSVADRVLANAHAYKILSGKCTGLLKKAIEDVNAYSGTYDQTKQYLDNYTVAWPS